MTEHTKTKAPHFIFCAMISLLLLIQAPHAAATSTTTQKDYSINHPFYVSISELEKMGVVRGTSSHTVEPDREITTAEYLTFVARLFKLEVAKQTSGPWHKPYEEAAIKAGIFQENQLKSMGNKIAWSDIYPSSLKAAKMYPHHSSVFSDMPIIYTSEPVLSCAYTLIDAGLISPDIAINKTPTRGEVLDYLYKLYRSNYVGAETDKVLSIQPNDPNYPKRVHHNQAILSEMKKRPGMTGRWIVPDLEINVATFKSFSQAAVDLKDSAAMFTLGSMKVVADHDYQGFKALVHCPVGTIAYFDFGAGIAEYVCTASFFGHNIKSTLTDSAHNDIKYSNPGGITCYTCCGSARNIWIAFFSPSNF